MNVNKKLWLWATVGALSGAAAVQTAHVINDRNTREVFDQRLRCKSLADKYVKGRHSGIVIVSRVEYSRSRGSCIASTFEQFGLDTVAEAQLGLKPSAEHTYMFNVVDLLTGEDLVNRTCTTSKVVISNEPDCVQSGQRRDAEFEAAR